MKKNIVKFKLILLFSLFSIPQKAGNFPCNPEVMPHTGCSGGAAFYSPADFTVKRDFFVCGKANMGDANIDRIFTKRIVSLNDSTCFENNISVPGDKKLLVNKIEPVDPNDCKKSDPVGTTCFGGNIGIEQNKSLLVNRINPVDPNDCKKSDPEGTTCFGGEVIVEKTFAVRKTSIFQDDVTFAAGGTPPGRRIIGQKGITVTEEKPDTPHLTVSGTGAAFVTLVFISGETTFRGVYYLSSSEDSEKFSEDTRPTGVLNVIEGILSNRTVSLKTRSGSRTGTLFFEVMGRDVTDIS